MSTLHNPVLSSELKVRMRGWKTAIGIMGYMLAMAGVALAYFGLSYMNGQLNPIRLAETGRACYIFLASVQFAILIFIVPALTAGTISSERERQTLDLLLCTRMSPFSIVTGKLLSSIGYISLLIMSTLPTFALVFMFGGIRLQDVLLLFVFQLVCALCIGSLGVFCSTLFKRTITATVMSYMITLVLGFGLLLIGLAEVMMQQAFYNNMMIIGGSSATYTFYVPLSFLINPGVGLADLLMTQASPNNNIIQQLLGYGNISNPALTPWISSTIFMLALSALAVLGATFRLRPSGNSSRGKTKKTKGKASV